MTAEALRSELPALDPERQRAAERLCLLVEAAGNKLRFKSRVEHRPSPGAWLVGANGIALRIDELDGVAPALHPDRVDSLANALDRIESALDELEAFTGWVIEPEAGADEPAPDAVVAGVEAWSGDRVVARFALALPPALITADASPGERRLAAMPVPVAVRALAAQLAVEDAGALGPGDLLILAPAPWEVVLTGPFGEARAALEPGAGRLTALARERSSPLPDQPPAVADAMRAFRVPVEVSLPGTAASLAELAALRGGGTLPLGPVTAGLAVTLSVGGRALATGEIVRLGDRFAVLVDELVDAATVTGGQD